MSAEYVTDVTYLRSFYADLAPARLRLVAALNGFAPPPAEDFDYAELGCAFGDTTVTLAAANPRARFLGIDLNPEHIAVAQASARDGGLTNVRFLERDFGELARPNPHEADDIGTFDFLCAHGVMSWVGPETRSALLDFASARLKPGGLLYVSYNAMPGWAAVEPLRQLLLSRAPAETDSLERARQGLDFAKQMLEAGAEYFVDNPPAREMLATMEKMGLRYVVHEYMHAHWAPMYFANVAWDMARRDLHFVGSFPLYSSYRELAIPTSLAKVFETARDRVTFESLKDFALNEYFRRDVYVKGKAGHAEETTQAYLDSTSFVAREPRPPAPDARETRLPHHTLSFTAPIFDALFDAFAEGAATAASLAKRPALHSYGASNVRAAIVRMLLADHIAPVNGPTLACDPAGTDLFNLTSDFNRRVLQRRLSSETPIVLASPVTGTGIPITALQAVAIRLLTEVPPAERVAWVHAHFGRDELRMTVRDRPVESAEEQTRIVLEALAHLENEQLAKLIELGVLEPTA